MTKKSTACTSPKNRSENSSGKTSKGSKGIAKKAKTATKFTKEVTCFRNAKDYFSLDDRVKHW